MQLDGGGKCFCFEEEKEKKYFEEWKYVNLEDSYFHQEKQQNENIATTNGTIGYFLTQLE